MAFTIEIGKTAPSFTLKDVDGKMRSLEDYAGKKAIVLAFTCNHCPVSIQYEDRLIALQKSYEGKGVQLIAINPNETDNHPTDSYEQMIQRAKEKGFNFPYLRDETQEVAKAYGAKRTPHVFLLDGRRKVVYQGRIDDNAREPEKVTRKDLQVAIDETLAGKSVSVPTTVTIGCNVKWWGKEEHWMPES